jgi:hypothetical protein
MLSLMIALTAVAVPDYAMFAISVQDFAYSERSAAIVRRVVELHEKHGVPLDLYLTTTMTDRFAADAPDLIGVLKRSPVAVVSYHVRPPTPYFTRYDWIGLRDMEQPRQLEVIRRCETHGLDLTTGQPTDEPGGYLKLKELIGYAPRVVSAQADVGLVRAADSVFRDLGARFFVVHGRPINLGERRSSVALRPEHVDLRLFEHVGEKPAAILDRALAEARKPPGARAPYFVGLKMHDSDFFVERSAWVTVYVEGRRRPDWDLTRKAALLSEERQRAVWEHYEAVVKEVAARRDVFAAVNSALLAQLVEQKDGGNTAVSPPSRQTTKVYLSGTMHIETNRMSWPDADRLIDFFQRATAAGRTEGRAAGMWWSIGADIG